MAKGQIFIIIAVITVVAIVLLKTSLNLTNVLDNKRFLELGLERMEFQNLKSELSKIIQISYNQSNISSNLHNFMSFAKDSFLSRTTLLTGMGLTAMFPNVTSNIDAPLNVTVFNYLDEDVGSLNLTFNGSQQNFTSFSKSSILVMNFTIRTVSDVNFSLVMRYSASSFNSTENITIPVEIGKAKLVGFFDMKISSIRLEQRDKFTETVALNDTRRV